MLCEFLRAHEGKSPLTMKSALLGLYKFWDANTFLGVVELLDEFMVHCQPAIMEFFKRFTYNVKAAPSSDCTKYCNNGACLKTMDHL